MMRVTGNVIQEQMGSTSWTAWGLLLDWIRGGYLGSLDLDSRVRQQTYLDVCHYSLVRLLQLAWQGVGPSYQIVENSCEVESLYDADWKSLSRSG
jgi:hypothetical protein